MKITLDKVPEEGALDIEFSEDEKTLNSLFSEGLEQDYHFDSPLKGSFHITKTEKTVFIDLDMSGSLKVDCSRCLAGFEYPVTSSLHLTLFPYVEESGETVELAEDEIEKNYYHEESLCLDEIMRAEAALLLPISPLCGESCKGICPQCGQNLNKKSCNCIEERIEGKFEALKNLKLNENKH